MATSKMERFHLYSPSWETKECYGSHYYDSITKLPVISYASSERSTPECSNSRKFSKQYSKLFKLCLISFNVPSYESLSSKTLGSYKFIISKS